jgi:hypothetical protein
MGVLSKILGGNKNANYSLTELGKQKADDMVGGENWRCVFMSYIADHQPVTVNEVVEGTGCEFKRTKKRLEQLSDEGLLTKAKSE